MAAVITSRGQRAEFLDDPGTFALQFELEPSEVDALRAMGSDLAKLTNAFVMKRIGMLRWSLKCTLALLGPDADPLLEEYASTVRQREFHRDEVRSFCDFVVEHTDRMSDGSQRCQLVCEMARFERHYSDAFLEATPVRRTRFDDEPAGRVEPSGCVRIRPGTNTGSFSWDLRMLYWGMLDSPERVHSDPCTLAFFHGAKPNQYRVIRLRSAEYPLLALLPPGETVPVAQVQSALGDAAEANRLLGALACRGVLQWV